MNWKFFYTKSSPQQLNNNFSIKVEVVGVAIEWKPCQGFHGVQPITAMELGQGAM